MKKRLRAVLALILIILLCLPAIAQTADPDALCALTIDCHYENKPVSGMGFSLYRVAALSPQGEHTLLPAYEDSGIVLGNLRDAADWRQAAGLLGQWVEQQSISPEKQLTTAADGKAALEGLPTGLYLLCAAPYQKGGCTYTTTPVLLELPAQQAGGGWQYAATVEPKLERSGTPEPPVIIIPGNPAPTPGDKLPQTGLLQWPITLLAAIGVLLVAVGCRLRRRRKPT